MPVRYNAETSAADRDTLHPQVTRIAEQPNWPELYAPSRRRMHPMFVASLAFALATGAFYGAESLLPPEYRPSKFTGGYDREIQAAKTEGELRSRIVYDKKIKLFETAAGFLQERCRANLQNYNNLYNAAYSRANTYAQLTGDIQRQYTSMRYQIVAGATGGEQSTASMATTFGYIFGLFDPGLKQQAFDIADEARERALQKLDDAARGGITVSVEGWNTGLPDPTTLPKDSECDMPSSFPGEG